MTETIAFANWVDWLAIELTFRELYESAPPPVKHEMTATVRRLAEGIDEAEVGAFVSRVPNFERGLRSFSVEEQRPLRRSVDDGRGRTGLAFRQHLRRSGSRPARRRHSPRGSRHPLQV
ncbi:hypothetical protein [Candidatus Palauibacter sp.]|uniref:hypothetical protein n=1 Tax=Candidatus Palauibacter sp. TaxID=3101350 RepID=UPI003B01B304